VLVHKWPLKLATKGLSGTGVKGGRWEITQKN